MNHGCDTDAYFVQLKWNEPTKDQVAITENLGNDEPKKCVRGTTQPKKKTKQVVGKEAGKPYLCIRT